MANHDVKFDIPVRRLGKTDVNFYIDIDGERFGQLSISRGAVVWFPKGAQKGLKMTWRKFNEMMQQKAGRQERRK